MPRPIATNRTLAFDRKPAMARTLIGYINDGKIHAVLDTNVPINAIWALNLGIRATQTEKDCLFIVNLINENKITIGISAKLFSEYQKKASHHLASGKVKEEQVSYVLNVVGNKDYHASVRMLVDPQRVSKDPDDDMLFDGLYGDYLISDDMGHVKPESLLNGIQTPYAETLSPSDFVTVFRTRGFL